MRSFRKPLQQLLILRAWCWTEPVGLGAVHTLGANNILEVAWLLDAGSSILIAHHFCTT